MVSAQPRQGPRVQGHQNGLLWTDRNPAKLPIHLDSIAKCLDINAKDYCHLRHSNGMQTNPLLISTTIGDSWPIADGLVWGALVRKLPFNGEHILEINGRKFGAGSTVAKFRRFESLL